LKITSETRQGSNFVLTVAGPSGLAIAVQSSTNLVNWTSINIGALGTGLYSFVHSNAPTAQMFYRINGLP
jgi:hypothetical protein